LLDFSSVAAFFRFLRKSLRCGIGISSPFGVYCTFSGLVFVMASLAPVRQKIEWAKAHLKTLDTETRRYLDSEMCELVFERNPNAKIHAQRLNILIPIPENIPLIIGDCIHNLRCALDYLVWQLVLAAGNEPEDCNQFPICTTADLFEKATIKRGKRNSLKGVSPEAAAEIEAVQPYIACKGGETRSTLYFLHHLSNADKHRRILVTVPRGAGWNTVFDESGSEIHGFPTPRYDGTESRLGILPFTPTQKVQVQTSFVPFIAFDEGLPTDYDVRIIIDKIGASIEKTLLPRFEQFFT
jgi:hypothetical protein